MGQLRRHRVLWLLARVLPRALLHQCENPFPLPALLAPPSPPPAHARRHRAAESPPRTIRLRDLTLGAAFAGDLQDSVHHCQSCGAVIGKKKVLNC